MEYITNLSTPAKVYAIIAVLVILIKVVMGLTSRSLLNLLTHYGIRVLVVVVFTIIIEFLARFHNVLGWVVAVIFILSNIIALV